MHRQPIVAGYSISSVCRSSPQKSFKYIPRFQLDMNIDQAVMRAKALSNFLSNMINLLDSAQQDVSNNEMIKVGVWIHGLELKTLEAYHAYLGRS